MADLAVEEMAGREIFDGPAVQQGLELGSHVEIAVFVAPGVQRHDPHRVAGDQVAAALLVVEHEGENAVEVVQEIGAALLVEGEDHFAVRAGGELVGRGEATLELLVVVDLAVDRQHLLAVAAVERLGAVFDVDDGQPLVGQDRLVAGVDAAPVGPRWRSFFESWRASSRRRAGSVRKSRMPRIEHMGGPPVERCAILTARRNFASGFRAAAFYRNVPLRKAIAIGRTDTPTMPSATSEKFFLTKGTLPNRKPAPTQTPHPDDAAEHVVEGEGAVGHGAGAGHEGHEGAHDRHEAPGNHRHAAPLLEKGVRLRQVVAVEQAVQQGVVFSAVKIFGPTARPTA